MKLNNNIKTIVIATSTVLLLSACGGGGGETTPVEPAPTEPTGKVAKCDTNTYSTLEKNDKITALQEGTEVTIRHSEDGTREACVKNGDAKIN